MSHLLHYSHKTTPDAGAGTTGKFVSGEGD
jgi:hypothetical protein